MVTGRLAPMPPDRVRAAGAGLACRVADGAVLVVWGDLLPACSRPGLPVEFVSRIRRLTPTLLKRQGGARVAWFGPEAYVRALAGALSIAGLNLAPAEAVREVELARASTEVAVRSRSGAGTRLRGRVRRARPVGLDSGAEARAPGRDWLQARLGRQSRRTRCRWMVRGVFV